ncbi:hypothetical protein GQ53DRAFT_131297 [Thozetella sp. PMI_491]|nr:hypothetical protein GQ53DRAFT_131297 [Thozetella sp. PMI_491]
MFRQHDAQNDGKQQRGIHPGLVARNNSSPSNYTVNLFLDSFSPDTKWAASIVTACADQTVYVAQCTDGPDFEGMKVCGTDVELATVTEGDSFYEATERVVASTLGYNLTLNAKATCSLKGKTAADCQATEAVTGFGTALTTISTSLTLTGATYYRYNVEITARAENMAAATGTCQQSAGRTHNIKAITTFGLLSAMGVSTFLLL